MTSEEVGQFDHVTSLYTKQARDSHAVTNGLRQPF